ncbi:hypothetical protein ACQ1PO_11700, partial [Ornithobacterium rhinotracheale]
MFNSDDEVEKYIENFRLSYGKMSEAEEVGEGAYIKGVFYELDENGEETSAHYHANVFYKDLKDKKAFDGKKKGDKVEIEAKEIFEDQDRLAQTFGLEEDEVADF